MHRIGAVIALLGLGACSKPGGSSPEDVFRKAQSAVSEKDWKKLFTCFDPQNADENLRFAMIAAAFAVNDHKESEGELDGIYRRYGIGKDDPDPHKKVRDKAACYADLMNFRDAHRKNNNGESKWKDHTLKDVTMDGDSASGTLVGNDGKTEAVNFVKREGRWYIGRK